MTKRIVWHYTTGAHFKRIAADGILIPATEMVPQNEKPVLWFSSRTEWPPTACKSVIENGDERPLTFEETVQRLGAVRFGIRRDWPGLHGWPKLAKKANMDHKEREALEAVARDRGEDPTTWFGMTKALPLHKCALIQAVDPETMEWRDVKPDRAPS